MKDKKYVKAFKALKRRLRDIVHDQKASLYFIVQPDGLVVPAFIAHSIRYMFVDANNQIDNATSNVKLEHMRAGNYSTASFFAKTGLKHPEFMKIWIRSALGNDLCISAAHKLLDSHDTIESLCVEYDMKNV